MAKINILTEDLIYQLQECKRYANELHPGTEPVLYSDNGNLKVAIMFDDKRFDADLQASSISEMNIEMQSFIPGNRYNSYTR